MASRKLKFALFGNEYQAKKSVSIQKILSCLSERKADVYIDRNFYEFLTRDEHWDLTVTDVFDGDDFAADFVISMGGDGTFLKAASRVGAKEIPIMGVNMGRLGFLADVSSHEIESALEALYTGDYTLEAHSMIRMEVSKVDSRGQRDNGLENDDSHYLALNDIAVLKRDNASMISIRTNIDGEYLMTYQADGLIVSTPTGSTAYNLSNGGPIIVPQADILCLTPVAPHSLNTRPIVIRDDSEVTLTVESRSHNFLVAVDGRSEKLEEGNVITIKKAPHPIRIIKRHSQRYFSTLREKMMWGADSRG